MVSWVGVQFDALLFPHLMLLEYQFNQSLHSSVHPCQFTVIGGWGGGLYIEEEELKIGAIWSLKHHCRLF